MYLMDNPYFEVDNVISGKYEKIWSIPKIKHDSLYNAPALIISINNAKYEYNPNNHDENDYYIDLSAKTLVISNWNSATSNGEYLSVIDATNAPTSTIVYIRSVVHGETSITQKLYADTNDLIAVSEYIRRGKITVNSDNNETITWVIGIVWIT